LQPRSYPGRLLLSSAVGANQDALVTVLDEEQRSYVQLPATPAGVVEQEQVNVLEVAAHGVEHHAGVGPEFSNDLIVEFGHAVAAS
jgi:hypothetical protein